MCVEGSVSGDTLPLLGNADMDVLFSFDVCLFVVLGIDPKSSCEPGQTLPLEPCPQPSFLVL
jgi:hypothetical protein